MTRDYPSDWNSRRKKVYRRDNHTCQNCGASGDIELHAHHIVPKSKGGSHELSNLKALCSECHKAIHGDSMAPTAKEDSSRASSSSRSIRSSRASRPSEPTGISSTSIKAFSQLIKRIGLLIVAIIASGIVGLENQQSGEVMLFGSVTIFLLDRTRESFSIAYDWNIKTRSEHFSTNKLLHGLYGYLLLVLTTLFILSSLQTILT